MDTILLNVTSNFINELQTIINNLQNDDGLKKTIAQIKKIMFDDNTHNWAELTEGTINYKSGLKKIPRENVTKPNVRYGKLRDEFADYTKIKITNDFDIEFELSDKGKKKLDVVQEHGRDPVKITDEEYEIILEYVVSFIVKELEIKYGNN